MERRALIAKEDAERKAQLARSVCCPTPAPVLCLSPTLNFISLDPHSSLFTSLVHTPTPSFSFISLIFLLPFVSSDSLPTKVEEQKKKKEELLKHARDKRVEAVPIAQEKETDIHGTQDPPVVGCSRPCPSPSPPLTVATFFLFFPPHPLPVQSISTALSVDSASLLDA